MQRDGIYAAFLAVVQREYSRVFGSSLPLKGSEMQYCLPISSVPDPAGALPDFTSCN
jgi:hypothetical protein